MYCPQSASYPGPPTYPQPQQPFYPDPPVNINNPAIPFNATIVPKAGRLFTINGVVLNDCKRFSVNFFVNGNESDCALHIDWRYDENVNVRNSRINGKWEIEERTNRVPIARGMPFEMMILVERCRYMIACNGQHFAEYAHRIPLSLIHTLTINGQVGIQLYRETNVNSDPPAPLFQPLYPRCNGNQRKYDILGGFVNGRMLHIMGITRTGTFTCDFLPQDDARDVGLHISCRVGEGITVLNSFQNSQWQAEIRPPKFVLRKRQHFLMEIQSHPNEFRLLLNGVEMATFPVRHIPPHYITVLSINGEIDHRYVART